MAQGMTWVGRMLQLVALRREVPSAPPWLWACGGREFPGGLPFLTPGPERIQLEGKDPGRKHLRRGRKERDEGVDGRGPQPPATS